MIPPTTNDLKMHSDNLAELGRNLQKLNGAGKALANAAVVAVVLVGAVFFLPEVLPAII